MTQPSEALPDLRPGALIAGKYRLDRVVGRGGMGAVWAARNEQLDMLVAMKFIEAAQGADITDAHARFEREARAAAQIRSPHVCQVFEHGVDRGLPYIAMELLEGEDLGQRLRRAGRLTPEAMARILTQAAKALRRAHDAGIIHRDLKPGNIFLARFDDDEVVKILDFGVAKVRSAGGLEGPHATQVGVVFGSPSYMSPEQARGVRGLDHRSDLWSLAVIAFRAITGVKPFQAATIGDLVVKLCIDPLPVATQVAPDLPPQVDVFFARAFAREASQRFASAVEMAAAFEAAASGTAAAVPSARPPASFPAAPFAPSAPPPSVRPLAAPTPQSGVNVAFAPGTLTPPPLPEPSPSEPARIAPPPATPAAREPAAPPRKSQLAVVAALGGVALLLLLVAVSLAARRTPVPAAPLVEPTASAVVEPPPPSALAVVEPPPAASAPLPGAVASAAPSAEAPPAEPSAEPASSSDPAPKSTSTPRKGQKRRPNFGY
jgi:serine/threonine-protein kinase